MPVGTLILNLEFPGCSSLKMKRGLVKPILFRLHREFFISIAEVDHLDAWSHAVIECALVANDRIYIQQVLHKVVRFIEDQWPDVVIQQEHIEILT
jgi:uncharacterized protein YlxP (DUF503 family)